MNEIEAKKAVLDGISALIMLYGNRWYSAFVQEGLDERGEAEMKKNKQDIAALRTIRHDLENLFIGDTP